MVTDTEEANDKEPASSAKKQGHPHEKVLNSQKPGLLPHGSNKKSDSPPAITFLDPKLPQHVVLTNPTQMAHGNTMVHGVFRNRMTAAMEILIRTTNGAAFLSPTHANVEPSTVCFAPREKGRLRWELRDCHI